MKKLHEVHSCVEELWCPGCRSTPELCNAAPLQWEADRARHNYSVAEYIKTISGG